MNTKLPETKDEKIMRLEKQVLVLQERYNELHSGLNSKTKIGKISKDVVSENTNLIEALQKINKILKKCGIK